MRRIWVVIFVALISVMLVVGMSQAALLTLESEHAITATLTKAGGGAINPSSYVMRSGVYGSADYPSELGINNSALVSSAPPATASATLGTGYTWLTTTDATTGHATATTFTMSQQYVGSAPDPSTPGGNDGVLSQSGSLTYTYGYVSNYFKLTYSSVAAGDYTAAVSDVYTFLYSLVQAAGSTNLYHTTEGYLYLYMQALVSGGGSGGAVWATIVEDGRGPTYPLADFSISNTNPGGDSANLSFDLKSVVAGRTITIEGILVNYQDGLSYNGVVPLPSTMLLLGSGLVGLGLLRRKWSFKK